MAELSRDSADPPLRAWVLEEIAKNFLAAGARRASIATLKHTMTTMAWVHHSTVRGLEITRVCHSGTVKGWWISLSQQVQEESSSPSGNDLDHQLLSLGIHIGDQEEEEESMLEASTIASEGKCPKAVVFYVHGVCVCVCVCVCVSSSTCD